MLVISQTPGQLHMESSFLLRNLGGTYGDVDDTNDGGGGGGGNGHVESRFSWLLGLDIYIL
jgi:hypothetical protein